MVCNLLLNFGTPSISLEQLKLQTSGGIPDVCTANNAVVVAEKLMKYIDSKWQTVASEDAYMLTKLEAQVTDS